MLQKREIMEEWFINRGKDMRFLATLGMTGLRVIEEFYF